MGRFICFTLAIFIASSSLVWGLRELRWGGPGYDPALKNSSRFMARRNIDMDKNTTEIWVDSKETVNEVGQMRLTSSDGKEMSSLQCWKAMRHIMAPWACSFRNEEIKQLSGLGKITVENSARQIIIIEVVNLDELRALAVETREVK